MEFQYKTRTVTYKILDYSGIKGNDRIVTTDNQEIIDAIHRNNPKECGIEIIEDLDAKAN